ncbi:MAG: hypothetical protein IOD03_15955 [Methylocystis sp.]|uniref:hypothetical protein n=1 Tax=Phenylobacterium sp. TaxID=1871053 RepID=UPI0025EABD0A|nr:hypothetical protein [Phenylobacterium sp.]MCA3585172.1 hypothetical protein [Methylocystis sp.]MCA6286275.1 hypothetical protein [Phenylobacterium sp.]MCA6288062.1 hypothetical protein [Phenylobacterium sp.]MCA6346657.1 hypothetical protein [Phenylobacterium sp.]MCA6349253.1 hypothetical protein [Phenylobacterium sp.]
MSATVAIVGCGLVWNRGPPSSTPLAARRAAVGAGGDVPDFTGLDEVIEAAAPNRADRRAMGPAMMAGCAAAWLALCQAGMHGQVAMLADMDLFASGRMTERLDEVDAEALSAMSGADDLAILGRVLRDGLRPSFFLSQLSNLLAANIAITQGVCGRSQTFLGNEGAGVDCVATGLRRIQDSASMRCLVGGVFRGQGACARIGFEAEARLSGRQSDLGSAAAFLVLENAAATAARGGTCLALLRSLEWEAATGRPVSHARDLGHAVSLNPPPVEFCAGHAPWGPEALAGRLSEAAFPTSLVLAVEALRDLAAAGPGTARILVDYADANGRACAIVERAS